MKQKMKIQLILLFSLVYSISDAQFIDNYGIRIGTGFSNQKWFYIDTYGTEYSEWKENKIGLAFYINGEKNFNDYFSIRSEIGYIQKGFRDDIVLTAPVGEVFYSENDNVVLHDLSFDMGFKIIPIHSKVKPYVLLGFRGDYLIGYKDVIFDINGEKFGLYKIFIDDYNKFVLSGLIGIGLDYNNLVYLDLEYNPALTKSYEKPAISIKDRYFGISIGLNISKLIKTSNKRDHTIVCN